MKLVQHWSEPSRAPVVWKDDTEWWGKIEGGLLERGLPDETVVDAWWSFEPLDAPRVVLIASWTRDGVFCQAQVESDPYNWLSDHEERPHYQAIERLLKALA